MITANHVAQDAISSGTHRVKLRRKGRTWSGTIIRTDDTNDLAVIRVHGKIAPALWQRPDDSLSPQPGNKLLLVGSPYGLEGTVTTGIVSRVSYDQGDPDRRGREPRQQRRSTQSTRTETSSACCCPAAARTSISSCRFSVPA